MNEVIARLVLQIAIVTLAFIIWLSAHPGDSMILAIPFFFGIPAILFTLIVLGPAELLAARYNLRPLFYALVALLPVSILIGKGDGATISCIIAIWTLLWGFTGTPWRILEYTRSG